MDLAAFCMILILWKEHYEHFFRFTRVFIIYSKNVICLNKDLGINITIIKIYKIINIFEKLYIFLLAGMIQDDF